jgi:hypothetical protein
MSRSMRDLIDLVESWRATHRVSDYRMEPIDIDVFDNPSKGEFSALLKQHESLRGLLLNNGDLLVWDAYATTHGEIEHHHPETSGAYPIFKRDRVVLNDINYYLNEGDCAGDFRYRPILRRIVEKLRKQPAIRAFYGPDPLIVGDDHENGSSVEITDEWLAANVCPG